MITHWVERQLLTTDNWVTMMAPLPKDEQVASALSTFTVDKLIASTDVQAKIADALPEKAAFLAGPLTDQIDQRATNLTKRLIKSDQFQGIWIAANRTAHSRLVNRARNGSGSDQAATTTSSSGKKVAGFTLDLSALKSTVVNALGPIGDALFKNQPAGGDEQGAAPAGGQGAAGTGSGTSIAVNLKQSFATFSKSVKLIDFLNGTLWLLGLACLLGALALSNSRRRLLLIISASFTIIALLQLIGVRALRPSIINSVENSAFRPAVGVIYDGLLASFRHSATNVFVVFLVIAIICIMTNPRLIARSGWVSRRLKAAGLSTPARYVRLGREWTARYYREIIGGGAFLMLVYMAFGPDFDWQGLIRAVLVVAIFASLVGLVSLRPTGLTGRAPPMKHA